MKDIISINLYCHMIDFLHIAILLLAFLIPINWNICLGALKSQDKRIRLCAKLLDVLAKVILALLELFVCFSMI